MHFYAQLKIPEEQFFSFRFSFLIVRKIQICNFCISYIAKDLITTIPSKTRGGWCQEFNTNTWEHSELNFTQFENSMSKSTRSQNRKKIEIWIHKNWNWNNFWFVPVLEFVPNSQISIHISDAIIIDSIENWLELHIRVKFSNF